MKEMQMFAVLKTGGKQYKVQSGDTLRVEKLAADAGDKVQFNEILMLGGDSPVFGAPFIDGAAVQAEVVDQIKGDKVTHFVKRRRKHGSQRTKGHRQQLTLLHVTNILEKGGDKSGVKAAIGAGLVAGAAVATAVAVKKSAGAKKADAKPAGKEAAPKKEAPKAETTDAVEGTKPANLLEKARGDKPDDLKKISGVGPKLESTLHENGVFHFDQIAAWNADEIAYMDDRLSFKGRIERDGWLAQASDLAAEKE